MSGDNWSVKPFNEKVFEIQIEDSAFLIDRNEAGELAEEIETQVEED